MPEKSSPEDKRLGLEPGEYGQMQGEHLAEREVLGSPDFAKSTHRSVKTHAALGGMVKWDNDVRVDFDYRKEHYGSSETAFGKRERTNFRLPYLFPVSLLGAVFFTIWWLGRGGSGLAMLAILIPTLTCCWLMSRRGSFAVGLWMLVVCAMIGFGVLKKSGFDESIKSKGDPPGTKGGLLVPHWVPPVKPVEQKKLDQQVQKQNEELRRYFERKGSSKK